MLALFLGSETQNGRADDCFGTLISLNQCSFNSVVLYRVVYGGVWCLLYRMCGLDLKQCAMCLMLLVLVSCMLLH